MSNNTLNNNDYKVADMTLADLAAWSCVEKILQLDQRTCAPKSTKVSMRTAV
jgi:hypothetical protein